MRLIPLSFTKKPLEIQWIRNDVTGVVAVRGGKVIARLPLPIGGLMSDLSIEKVSDEIGLLHQRVKEMGCTLEEPFMTLSFLALPVIPELKITDKGLVDVPKFKITPLFGDY